MAKYEYWLISGDDKHATKITPKTELCNSDGRVLDDVKLFYEHRLLELTPGNYTEQEMLKKYYVSRLKPFSI